MSPVKLPTRAIIRLATNVAEATPNTLIFSIPLAPKLNTDITIAMPIQMLAKPKPVRVLLLEVIGITSSEIRALLLFVCTLSFNILTSSYIIAHGNSTY
jgi:hypothetical protein